jgi:4-amino-4-deoxy-L-arabinose transferase-like glycosyltransferase
VDARHGESTSLEDAPRAGLSGLEWSAAFEWLASARGVVALLAAGCCLIHFLLNGRYGYFRDELYFAACGEHLAWGYVDHAPLIALLARVSRALLGDSLFAIRFFPALAAGAMVLLAGWIARELGGQRFAQGLAAAAVLVAPIYLTFGNLLTMNAFEPLFWGLCGAVAIRAVKTENPRLWLLFGIIAGLGILNKHSMLFFGSGIFLGLLFTPERRFLRSPWIWLGAAAALLLFLPNVVWQMNHGWPTLEFLQYRRTAENIPISPLTFIAQQALLIHPLAAPVAAAGLWFFLFTRAGKPYRLLGWAYLVVLTELIFLSGKIYYLAPFYIILFGAGAVWLEQTIAEHGREWMKPVLVIPLIVGGIIAAPLTLPILPVEAAARYARFWDVQKVEVERQPEGPLPQLFADMFGWENQVATVAAVLHRLPPEDQRRAVILAGGFGEAGAVDYFGPRYGLPKVVCAENAYYLWGPRGASDELVISFGINRAKLERVFGEIEQVAIIESEYAMPDENEVPVYICRKPRMPFVQAWPLLRSFG